MPELILHFDAGPDAEAMARTLQERAVALQGVDSAEAEAFHQRGVSEIVLALTLAVTVLNTGATTLDALKKFIESFKGVAGALGLRNLRVEVGSKVVAPTDLTSEHASTIEGGH